LTEGRLVGRGWADTSFPGALLDSSSTLETTFDRAEFADPRRFFRCRELVIDPLKRETGDDLGRTDQLRCGAVCSWRHGEDDAET
jgi:hypothetical protein